MSPFLQIFSSDARIFNKLAATTQADARIFNKLAAHCSIRKVPFFDEFSIKRPRYTPISGYSTGERATLSRLTFNRGSPLFLLK